MKNLQPAAVFSFFEEICRIPHESGHEQEMTRFLISFAKERNLPYKTDAIGNVVISKPATAGMEDRPCVVLQSHTDMVCEKNAGVEHDFAKDPIRPYVDGAWLRARGTTLGADDGIGVATELAILDASDIIHGPIECLFTVSEETGLDGANALTPEMLSGRILLNLDSEDEGQIFIGCAGGIDTTARFAYTTQPIPAGYIALEAAITGLTGGHSGDDIDKGRANANLLMARYLWEIYNKTDLRLCRLTGGNKRNAIAREANALFCVPEQDADLMRVILADAVADWKQEFHATEPNLLVSIQKAAMPQESIDTDTVSRLIPALYSCLHGVLAMSPDVQGLVETSTNLASVKMDEPGIIRIGSSQRSALTSSRRDAAARLEAHFRMAGADVTHESEYPGWAPDPNSVILKKSVDSYRRLFNKEPLVRAIHAGLECGLFRGVFPDMDMISFGPTLRGVHSPDECLEIATVQMFWDFLLDMLKTV